MYFKQMTEAEQEKKSYTILRQLGFVEREIMIGILRRQLLVLKCLRNNKMQKTLAPA
ncbi:hypothetical protein GRF59_03220 [Paenibacillus sp. HJL G12]|uniref:Uncharacterized protein n=1 Tax=Paenibacillus dendrobii TaxID=2691084 RepID=A0A7X3IEV6_9BACL|nr:hypothetical protein [Paenibacillus dendrobii]MWV42627.1 hypothetical protein [Paenibacillus dendrobii]